MSDGETRKVLLLGGGGCHDYKAICAELGNHLGKMPEFSVDYVAEDLGALHAERIAPYDLVVLYHTGGVLDVEAKRGLVEGVASGKGFVGVHSAADSFKNSPEYLAMIGGVFQGHPFIREYIVSLTDVEHPVTKGIEGYSVEHWEPWPAFEYKVKDEQYLLDYDPRVHVLATTVYSGILPKAFPKGALWPVAWVKPWGEGRVFYLALGHEAEACRNPFFEAMFANGAKWAAGSLDAPSGSEDERA